jgi:hypothetical protein
MTGALAAARRLREQAQTLPYASKKRADMLDEAARSAEAGGDEELCYDIRYELIDAALDAGEVQKSLIAFAYCLAMCDAEPEKRRESRLHWRYKWVLEWAPRFVEVSRAQIEELLNDVERRFTRANYGKNALAKLRARTASFLGDEADMARHYERWKVTPRDSMSDCRVCDLDEEVMLLQALGREQDARRVADTIVFGSQRCQEVPHLTYARMLPTLLRQKMREEAAMYHRRGYPMLKSLKNKLVGHVGPHLIYTAVVGETGRGLRILGETLAVAAEHGVAESRLSYFLGAELLLERVARSEARVHLTLPKALGGSGAMAEHRTSELSTLFAEAANVLAASFDARNGNTHVSSETRSTRSLAALDLSHGHVPEPNQS